MKENDKAFIDQVVDFYYASIDETHPQGNMSATADHFSITRAKVNKILITAGVIDSPLHRDIMQLKEQGYETDDIAAALGVSAATVKINIPYEKVIYNGEVKSAGAGYVEEYRKREQIFLNSVVRKKTGLEMQREMYDSNPTNQYMENLMREQGMFDHTDHTDDSVHLEPVFTGEEAKLFKVRPDVILLHIELDADFGDVKDLAEIKYGNTISRDILVHIDMPLHNLHYAINQAFGFTNSHLHQYTLCTEDLEWVTDGQIENWKKLIGLVFKNPIRDQDIDFWDDDYEGGSPKKWMRSKYTGPYYQKLFEEGYRFVREEADVLDVKSKEIQELRREFELDPFAVNEVLPVGQILSLEGREEYKDIKEYYDYIDACIEDADVYPSENQLSQPFVYPFAAELVYEYDYGDGWQFRITPKKDIEYLIKDGRLRAEEMRDAIKNLCILTRPIVVAADGLSLVEDVGGVYGYMDFLKGINGLDSDMYDDKKESLKWAKGQGWTGKIGNIKTLL